MKSEVVASHQELKFAMALSVSRIVYQACINSTSSSNMFPKLVMGDFCSVHDPLISRQLVPWLSEQLKKASDDIERIAMMAALGNIGHEVIIPAVQRYISSCEPSSRFESEWYERHRRSQSDSENPMRKKEWRQKWMAYKKKHSKEASVEDLLEKFEEQLRKEKEEGKDESQKSHRDHYINKKIEKIQNKSDKKEDKKDIKSSKKDDKGHYRRGHKEEKEDKYSKKGQKEDKKEDQEELKWSKKEEREELKEAKKGLKEEKKEEKEELKPIKKEEKEELKLIKSHMKAGEKDVEMMYEVTDEDDVMPSEIEEENEEEDDVVLSINGVEDRAACNILRTKAIFALSTLAVNQNPIISKILMPIYFNKDEETEIRLSALSLLFISNPPVAFWERVALSTWVEPNDQVSHYIYTTIASLVNNKDPKRRDITQRAEAVVPMMKPMRWTSFVSSNYLKAGYDEKTRLGYLTKTVNFPGFESFIPANHYNSLYLNLGPWFARLGDISINSKQPEKFLDMLLGKPFLRGKNNKDEAAHVHPDLIKMQEELKIEARATGQPEIFVYVNLMDNYQRFWAITPQSVEKMVEKLIRKSIERGIEGKSVLSYHKMLPMIDAFIRVPSAMGLAYSFIAQTRLFTSVKTDARTSVDFKSLKSMNAQIEGTLLPVLNWEMASKITIEVPFTRSYPTAGVHIEMSVALPGRFAIVADMDKNQIQTSWEFLDSDLRLLRHATIPYTTIRKLGDYTPSLLLAETKPITLLDSPLKVSYFAFPHLTSLS